VCTQPLREQPSITGEVDVEVVPPEEVVAHTLDEPLRVTYPNCIINRRLMRCHKCEMLLIAH
jgi:hypothetical protein